MNDNLPPALFLMGPTASGKSQLALEIAAQFPVEIISVDSAQIYRCMNIGTAKPDQETLKNIPHHLIDMIDPTGRYSVAQFRRDALNRMQEITRRRKIPLLVGGTMLYFQALLEGLSELPPADRQVRETIENEAMQIGWPAMHAKLSRVDPATAARLKQTDSQRIQRALEVWLTTGRPMSELFISMPRNALLPYQVIQFALQPSDRTQLHGCIARRFDKMVSHGLIEEVASLRETFALTPDLPSMRCVGYRQAWLYLDRKISLNELHDKGIAATRQLAKRQLTWIRSIMKRYEVIEFDCLADHLAQQIFIHLDRIK